MRLVSGLVWLAAGVTSQLSSIARGFAVLFFAGMLIFPISKLVLKIFFSRTPESNSNSGGLIVMETVFPMIGCLFVAWLILPYRPKYVFPIASIAVGAHYFGFRTAYGSDLVVAGWSGDDGQTTTLIVKRSIDKPRFTAVVFCAFTGVLNGRVSRHLGCCPPPVGRTVISGRQTFPCLMGVN